MNTRRRILCAVAAAPLSGFANRSDGRDVQTIEVADFRAYLEDTHPVKRGLSDFAARVGQNGQGTMKIVVRADTLPGSPQAQIQAFRSGQEGAPHLMVLAATGLAALEPAFALLDLPFAFWNGPSVHRVLDGPFGAALLSRLERHGLIGLSWWESGFRQMTSSVRPLNTLEAFAGLRLRTIPEPVFTGAAKALGAIPLAMPFNRVHAALKEGAVDAQDNTEAQILQGRFHEVQRWLTLTNHSYGALVLVARAGAWASFSDQEQVLLRKAAMESSGPQRQWAFEDSLRVRSLLMKEGMQLATVSDHQRERMVAATQAFRDAYKAQLDPSLAGLYSQALRDSLEP